MSETGAVAGPGNGPSEVSRERGDPQQLAATNQLSCGRLDPVGYELRMAAGTKGDGVYATRCFDIGEKVMVGEIERRVSANDSHATQVSRTKWVRHGGLGPKVNHSCSPNCGVRLNDSGACDFVARKPITAGEEITFDYAMRNYSIEHFPQYCRCGSPTCRGSITGWKDLPDERKGAYAGLVAPYLLEIDREAPKPGNDGVDDGS